MPDIGCRVDAVVKLQGDFLWWPDEAEGPKTFTFAEPTLVVADIKTLKHEYFRNVVNSHKFGDYYSQLQVYMHFLKLDWALVFAIQRDDDEQKEFLIKRDDAYIAGRLA